MPDRCEAAQFDLFAFAGESGMRITAIDHVQLAMPVDSEGLARAFYTGLLGIPAVPKPEALAKRGGVWFQDGGLCVHLGVEPDFRPARKAHPGFLVEDLPALATRLREAGQSVVLDQELPGYDRFHVHDPFGNRLEFMEAR